MRTVKIVPANEDEELYLEEAQEWRAKAFIPLVYKYINDLFMFHAL